MAIGWLSASFNNNDAAGTTLTITTGATAIPGAFYLAVIYSAQGGGGPAHSGPAGWTQVATHVPTFDVYGTGNMAIYTKTVGSSEPSSYTFTGPGNMSGGILQYGGVSGLDGPPVFLEKITNDTAVPIPSITSAPTDWWVAAGGGGFGWPLSAIAPGFTARVEAAGYTGRGASFVWDTNAPTGIFGPTGSPSGGYVNPQATLTASLLLIPAPTVTNPATVVLGPLAITAGGTVSGTPSGGGGGGGGTVTGSAALNLGPFTVATHSTLETVTATAAVVIGPLIVVAISGRVGPKLHPVPGYRGRWRLTLHQRPYKPATLASTLIAELGDARGRRLEQTWNQPATLTFTLDGHDQAAALIQELQHDVVAWRWDDQTGLEQPVFRGPISQSEDQITEQSHTVTYTCHDYTAMLARRILTATYAVTGWDQDNIVADLLARAVGARTSTGASLAPASFLPMSLYPANPNGSLRGLTGRTRDRTYYGSQNIAEALGNLATVDDGFDFDVRPSAVDTTDSLRLFYPQQGITRQDGIALQYGSTVAALTRSVNSADYANYVRVLGNNGTGSPTPQLYAEAWNNDAHAISPNPVGLWMTADDAADVTLQGTLNETAVGDLNTDATLYPSYTLTMAPDAYTWGNPNMGDTVPLIVQSGRLNVNTAVRVLGIAYDIGDDGQEDVTLTVGRNPATLGGLFKKTVHDLRALNRR